MKQPIIKYSNQYLEAKYKLLEMFDDCLKFGHGEIVIKSKKQSNDRRELHLIFGKDHKFIFSLTEMKG